MKKILSFALVVCMLATSLFTFGVSADTVTPVTYTPDTDYWAVDANGDFTATKNADGAYEIDSEEKLLGLATVLNPMKAADAQKATEGETFLITKDMNLNPHITDWSDPKSIVESTVTNPWPMITRFYGTLDGGGHTVKGIYANNYPINPDNPSNTVNFGIIGNLCAGGVQNIAFDDSFVIRKHGVKTAEDRAGGFIAGILDAATTYTFKNIYVGENATVAGAEATAEGHYATKGLGGIVGEAGNTAMTVNMENVVFAGQIILPSTKTNQEAGMIWQINSSVSAVNFKNCLYITPDTDPHISRHNTIAASLASTNILITADAYTYITNFANAITNRNADFVQTNMGVLPTAIAKMLSVEGILPDTAYWAVDSNGTFTAANMNGVYEIDSEAKLLGLASVVGRMTGAQAKTATEGKTFVLTKDMVFNSHVTDWSNVQESAITDFWPMMSHFDGTLDGAGYSITGLYANIYPINSENISNTLNWGMIGEMDAGGVRNLTLDNSYIARKHGTKSDDRTGGVLAGTVKGTATFDNIYIGTGVKLVGAPVRTDGSNQTKALGGLIGETPNGTTLTLNVSNVVFAGTIAYSVAPGSGVGSLIGMHQSGTTANVSDYIVVGNYDKLAGSGTVANQTRCASAVTSVPTENAGYWVETTKGVMPVKLADMMSGYKWQATQAEGGMFSVRIVGEVASLAYDAVGFKVTLYKNDTKLDPVNNIDNTAVYEAVKANKGTGVETYDASTFNQGFLDGADNMLFVCLLNNLDATAAWKIEVTAVYTIGTDVIESAITHTTEVAPYVVG